MKTMKARLSVVHIRFALLIAASFVMTQAGCRDANQGPVAVKDSSSSEVHPTVSYAMMVPDSRVSDSGVCTDTSAPGVAAPLRTFYVNGTSGNDAADGLSLATAWRTLAKANATARAGDLFLLTGTFTNQFIRPNGSGTSTNKIVYRGVAGSPGVLDHGQYDVIVWLDGRQHVVVDGLEIKNERYSILLRYGAGNVWLRNLNVHDIGYAVQMIQSSDNRVENSTITRCGSASANSGDCIWIADGSSRNVIARNDISYSGHGTIFIGGDKNGMAPSQNNVVVWNDLSNPWAANIGLIGFATGTVVECNKVRDSSTSGINYARTGIQISAQSSIVRYNEVYGNTSDGIQLQAYNFQGLQENSTGNLVYNNSVWGNGGAGLQILQKDVSQASNNVVQNNVFWGNNAASNVNDNRYYNGSYQDIWVDLYNANSVWPAGSLNGNIIRNNILARNAADIGQGWLIIVRSPAGGNNLYYTMAQAQATFSGAYGNLQADPKFTNASAYDFHLQSTSPAIDAGVAISGVKYLGSAPDLGAFESGGGAPPPPPAAPVYYVDAVNGADSSDGRTLQTAWRTLAKANATAQPGDTVKLTGTFSSQYIRPAASGTPTQAITFKAVAGSTAVLDHGVNGNILALDGRSYIVVDGLEIRNDANPVVIRAGAHHITLRNVWVHDASGSGVQILQSSDNRIENSRISRCGGATSGLGDCVYIADGSSRNVVTRDSISFAGRSAVFIGEDGVTMASSDDNAVSSNDIANPWADNLIVAGFVKRTTVEYNTISNAGTAGSSARAGMQITADASVVRFNDIYGNTADAIQLQAYTAGGVTENATNNQVYNNTGWGNRGSGVQIAQFDVAQVGNNMIQNNIFWGNNTDASRFFNGAYQDIWIDLYHASTVWAAGSLNGNTFRNNIAARDAADAGQSWLIIVRSSAGGGNLYYTTAQAASAYAGISGNIQADPLLVNASGHDFRLQSTSPAIDAGIPIAGVSYLGAAPDLGAHELR